MLLSQSSKSSKHYEGSAASQEIYLIRNIVGKGTHPSKMNVFFRVITQIISSHTLSQYGQIGPHFWTSKTMFCVYDRKNTYDETGAINLFMIMMKQLNIMNVE